MHLSKNMNIRFLIVQCFYIFRENSLRNFGDIVPSLKEISERTYFDSSLNLLQHSPTLESSFEVVFTSGRSSIDLQPYSYFYQLGPLLLLLAMMNSSSPNSKTIFQDHELLGAFTYIPQYLCTLALCFFLCNFL